MSIIFESPRAKRIEEIRSKLAEARHLIALEYLQDKLWTDWLSPSEGAITCSIESLYNAMEEIEKHYQKWEKNGL